MTPEKAGFFLRFTLTVIRRNHINGVLKNKMKSKPQIFLSLLAIPLFCIALHASATPITNIVTNGGFETGNFIGWTQSGNTDFTGVDSDSAHSGGFGAFAGPVKDLGYLSQTLNTVAGMAYDLSFFLVNAIGSERQSISPIRPGGGPVTQVFQVFWNGSLVFQIPPTADPSAYTQINLTGLLATGVATELRFGFRNDDGFWNIDDIVAGLPAGASVPEALSTVWLALPVVGMFAFLQLRRKRA
jgi:hypothetical protein